MTRRLFSTKSTKTPLDHLLKAYGDLSYRTHKMRALSAMLRAAQQKPPIITPDDDSNGSVGLAKKNPHQLNTALNTISNLKQFLSTKWGGHASGNQDGFCGPEVQVMRHVVDTLHRHVNKNFVGAILSGTEKSENNNGALSSDKIRERQENILSSDLVDALSRLPLGVNINARSYVGSLNDIYSLTPKGRIVLDRTKVPTDFTTKTYNAALQRIVTYSSLSGQRARSMLIDLTLMESLALPNISDENMSTDDSACGPSNLPFVAYHPSHEIIFSPADIISNNNPHSHILAPLLPHYGTLDGIFTPSYTSDDLLTKVRHPIFGLAAGRDSTTDEELENVSQTTGIISVHPEHEYEDVDGRGILSLSRATCLLIKCNLDDVFGFLGKRSNTISKAREDLYKASHDELKSALESTASSSPFIGYIPHQPHITAAMFARQFGDTLLHQSGVKLFSKDVFQLRNRPLNCVMTDGFRFVFARVYTNRSELVKDGLISDDASSCDRLNSILLSSLKQGSSETTSDIPECLSNQNSDPFECEIFLSDVYSVQEGDLELIINTLMYWTRGIVPDNYKEQFFPK